MADLIQLDGRVVNLGSVVSALLTHKQYGDGDVATLQLFHDGGFRDVVQGDDVAKLRPEVERRGLLRCGAVRSRNPDPTGQPTPPPFARPPQGEVADYAARVALLASLSPPCDFLEFANGVVRISEIAAIRRARNNVRIRLRDSEEWLEFDLA